MEIVAEVRHRNARSWETEKNSKNGINELWPYERNVELYIEGRIIITIDVWQNSSRKLIFFFFHFAK